MKKYVILFILTVILMTGCGDKPAIISDGTYNIEVTSSSSMFNIIAAKLTVLDGQMSAVLTLSGTGYEKLYMGTGEEALADNDDNCIYFAEDEDGKYTYTVPVTALDTDINVAAWSFRKETWYDRVLVFKSDSISADGNYTIEVKLSGGSGRATVDSPAALFIKDNEMTAVIIWSSPYYDYMFIDGIYYYPINTSGNSTFEIPVSLDTDIAVSALTTAMSEPHEIDYVLRFDSATLKMEPERSLELMFAENFSVDYYHGGYALISISDGSRFLIVPENRAVPDNIDEDITILTQPITNIYLVATSVMCQFDALDSLGNIRLSGSKADNWYNDNARIAMESGDIVYAGKYSDPDYELIIGNDCELAIQSTMINHTPEVKEMLEELGIAVLVDQSSYESHPLGRTEWIKLYGVLTGKEDIAERIFNEQIKHITEVVNTGKTVAFFYISSSGNVIARKSGDYVTKMIELAGGNYIFDNLGDPNNAVGTINLEMETFYATAKDADFIIYNSTIGEEIHTIAELTGKNELLKDFKAVQNGNVWCTGKNLFQETTQFGFMISDIRCILTESDENKTQLNFLYKIIDISKT